MDQQKRNVSKAGTDIDEVKRQNAQSGLTYNQVKQLLGEQYTGKK
ncbi:MULTISPECIES: hypothetical protein [Rossellomorea]|jgi:hypothetical protein|nr:MULTISPECIES: hypothetical protein [Rossellomorea]WGG46140.1 hypothetical protein P8596_02650 [Rossellomorea sp. DA94]